jgi:drug/metabolite transporter (DMT)-like permease
MQTKAIIQLIIASVLWGLGFVASSWSIRTFTSMESVTFRFLIAACLGQIVLLMLKKENSQFHLKDWLKALPAGILLGLMQLTQTIGLETTTSGKSAFITSLYILFVPLISSAFLKEPYRKINYLFCLLALVGTLFLVNPDFNNLKSGDLWTLVCALLAALHIIYTGFIADTVNELFRFNTYQSFWGFVLIAPTLLLQSKNSFFYNGS